MPLAAVLSSSMRHGSWREDVLGGVAREVVTVLPALSVVREGSPSRWTAVWSVRGYDGQGLLQVDGDGQALSASVLGTYGATVSTFGPPAVSRAPQLDLRRIQGFHGSEHVQVGGLAHLGVRHMRLGDGQWMQPEPLLGLGVPRGGVLTPESWFGAYAAGDAVGSGDRDGYCVTPMGQAMCFAYGPRNGDVVGWGQGVAAGVAAGAAEVADAVTNPGDTLAAIAQGAVDTFNDLPGAASALGAMALDRASVMVFGSDRERGELLGGDLVDVSVEVALAAGTAGGLALARKGLRAVQLSIARTTTVAAPSIGKSIAGGHAFEKHVIKKGEFTALGIETAQDFAQHIDNIVEGASGSDIRALSGGRTAYWDDASGTVVIHNPSAADAGTAFRPKSGRSYFEGLE